MRAGWSKPSGARERWASGVQYAESMAAGVAALVQAAREGDVILTLGAGSVSQAGAMLLAAL